MKKLLLIALAFTSALTVSGQNAREEIFADTHKAGGLYYAYPGPQSVQTPAPKGFKPFYISHFGRHGSRWNTADWVYTDLIKTFKAADAAGALSPVGRSVLSKVEALWADMEGRVEELTPLGAAQHRGVADRMYASFPEAFAGKAHVTANSTTSTRVMMSMFAFCDQLLTRRPKLNLSVNASRRDEAFVANRTKESREYSHSQKWLEDAEAFNARHIHPARMMSTLFCDKDYVCKNVDDTTTYVYLYDAATIIQNCPDVADIDLYGIFDKQELYDLWLCRNYEYFAGKGPGNPAAGDTLFRSALPMLRHIIETADAVIDSGETGATLRFSHDSYLVPLATCMRLDGCNRQEADPEKYCDAFINYKVSPMCGNIQIIFFRNKLGSVIVKFLLNENETAIPVKTDIYPYYRWNDVKKYYMKTYGL